MKKEYFVIAGLVALLSVAACCMLFGQNIFSGCFFWECAPERGFHVLDWELPTRLFPEEAIVGHIRSLSEGHGEIEGGGQDVQIGRDIARYRYLIYRFPNIRKATSDFERIKRGMVDPKTNMEWKPPATLTFSSAMADEVYIACGDFFQYSCEMVARYQEYIVFFGAMINDEMTYAQFENIAAYIDEQISSRLYP